MPVPLTYPGVYIEEVPSGVRTIVGVATSITAFIGRALRGPVDDPVTISNFGDFERAFGGLGLGYPMGYAVRDFFLNGGTQAVVARLYQPAGGGAADGRAEIDANGLLLAAASPGTWANRLRARVDHDVPAPDNPGDPHPLPWVDAFNLSSDDLFNLTVRDTATGGTETFLNLTVADSPRRVDRVLEQESSLVRVSGDPPGSRATKTGLFALEKTDLFNLLCIPPDTRGGDVPTAAWSAALSYCQERRAMLLVDPPATWHSAADARDNLGGDIGLTGLAARNAALYFPRVIQADPLLAGQLDTFVPCGVVAGIIARTDATRGVWKAPAGTDAALRGVQGLSVTLTDAENGQLNPLGANSLRAFPITGPPGTTSCFPNRSGTCCTSSSTRPTPCSASAARCATATTGTPTSRSITCSSGWRPSAPGHPGDEHAQRAR